MLFLNFSLLILFQKTVPLHYVFPCSFRNRKQRKTRFHLHYSGFQKRAGRERGIVKLSPQQGKHDPLPSLFFLLCRGKARNSSFDAIEGLSPCLPSLNSIPFRTSERVWPFLTYFYSYMKFGRTVPLPPIPIPSHLLNWSER